MRSREGVAKEDQSWCPMKRWKDYLTLPAGENQLPYLRIHAQDASEEKKVATSVCMARELWDGME